MSLIKFRTNNLDDINVNQSFKKLYSKNICNLIINYQLNYTEKVKTNILIYDNNKFLIIKTNNNYYIYYYNNFLIYKSINDKSINDKSINDKSINDKSINDKSINDKSINDKSINDKLFIMRTRIYFNNKIFWQDIESFTQNNKHIANKIRKCVINNLINNLINVNTLIGIGGEYYIYFCCKNQYKQYIGFSNHQSIIDDANFNCKFYISNYSNNLVDYNNFKLNNNNFKYDVVINLITILDNVIIELSRLPINKMIIISCKPIKKLITKYFKMITIDYFINYDNIVSVSSWMKL
jgi:hypothetical protein